LSTCDLIIFEYLCEHDSAESNLEPGVKRPAVENANKGNSPAISNALASALLQAWAADA